MTTLMLLLVPAIYTSNQCCTEVQFELQSAVAEEIISQDEADVIAQKCFETYTYGY